MPPVNPASPQLPRERPLSIGRRGVLFDIVGIIILFGLLNLLADAFLNRYTTNYGYWLVHQKWSLLKHQPAETAWLVLGDSSCNQGVRPDIILDETGKLALNLCTIGNMITIDDLWMLEYSLKRFGPPERVIIVHVYDIWYRPLNSARLAEIPLPWGFWRDFSMSSEILPGKEALVNFFIERYLPLYSQSRSLGRIVRSALMEFKNPFDNGLAIDACGFFSAEEPKPDIVQTEMLDHIQFTSENSFYISYINEQALKRIIALADQYQFPVYIANAPTYEVLYQDASFQAYLDDVRETLSAMAAESANAQYLPEVLTFPADQMQNTDHLITPAAAVYTRWLLEQMAVSNPHQP